MAVLKYKDSNGNFISIPAITGPQGAPGKQGPQGIQGIQGPPGPIGVTPAITIDNTTETLPAGSNAYVSLTGPAEAPVLHFAIPRGEQGLKGTEYTIEQISNTTNYYMISYNTSQPSKLYYNTNIYMNNGVMYGAAWNDYAEYRKGKEFEPGTCVIEVGDGTLRPSNQRLERGASIVSDTYGFIIGKGGNPIAVCGRVLAKYNGDINNYKPGDPVCTGPNGTISRMTNKEVRRYPDRIIGYVSEIPTYEVWQGEKEIKVNNRIWIRIK